MDDIQALHAQILGCTACVQAGYLENAAPVVAGKTGNRMMLIGQAPGVTELEVRRPFQGRAGKELVRWMATIAITEHEFRSRVYMTSVTKCFPGRVPGGAGDRRPSRAEMALCRPWLEAQLKLVAPATILLVGGMAIELYLPKAPLSVVIGKRFERGGVVLVPLPHPSGASRWLNLPANKELLRSALSHVREEWMRVVAAVS